MHLICGPATVKFLGSEEQQKIWYPKFVSYEIVTCYAQTELGHGSDVSGIETTATYEVESESFILNTPTKTATKWWSGDNAKFSNFAIVMAKLIINGK